MNNLDLGVVIAAITLGMTSILYTLRVGQQWQAMKSEITYIRRDLDQILRLYRLTPIAEQERKRRR